ncbi:F-box domain containing protein [Pandoravirus dulcis]|uniref:F-box domain containing protein n=1 Tax=Pandoravirus dulcis TaxID=1349409 RepID=S4VYX5_9VIRU|nr:F-box domain containing protein [Pandoravirus dulcis]AGO83064.1 F-box domain containing protein [Pandoravirus dulcis]
MEIDEHALPTNITALPTKALLSALPAEILAQIVCWLSGYDLAAVACTCRALAGVADDERLWEAAYRRDIDLHGPPLEHADHAAHGMSARWIYGLMRAQPGRLRVDPSGQLAGRIVSSGGRLRQAGQFVASISDKGQPVLLPCGYAAMVAQYDDGRYYATEGRFTIDDKAKSNGVVTHRHVVTFDAAGRISGCESTYRGRVARGNYAGIGTIDYSDGTTHKAEFASNALTGRCVSTCIAKVGAVYSGQCVDGYRTAYGVMQYADGTTGVFCPSELGDTRLRIKRPAVDAAPLARLTKRIARKDGPGKVVALAVIHNPAADSNGVTSIADVRTALSLVRVTHRGHVGVGGNDRLVFLAVSDLHPDPNLAGRRFRDNCPAARALLGLDGDAPPPFAALDRLHTISPDAARVILDNGLGGDSDHRACAADRGIGLAFGVVLGVDDDNRHHTVDAHSVGAPWRVRCFLTGRCVPAVECVMAHGGRFYHAAALSWWASVCNGGDSDRPAGWDPETGASIHQSEPARIVWEPWMASVPPRLLAACGTETMRAVLPRGHLGQRTAQDLVRLSVLTTMEATSTTCARPRGIEVLVAAAAGSSLSTTTAERLAPSFASPSLLRSFDMVALEHVELTHPSWDPRGPWLHGPHEASSIDDPTLAQYERWTCADAPDRDLAAHGILRIALDRPSFVGARLTGVFFFGQRFDEASFVGAVLDRCVFVGCVFGSGCLMMRAAVLECDLCDCTQPTADGGLAPFTLEDLLERSNGAVAH